MVTLQDIHDAPATLNADDSMQYFWEVMAGQHDWRCYSSASYDDTEYWARRFVLAHARVPSLLGTDVDTAAFAPMEVFTIHSTGTQQDLVKALSADMDVAQARALAPQLASVHIHGALYHNGALIWMSSAVVPEHLLLFVDDPTAYLWNYPSDNYIYTARMFNPRGSVAE